VEFTEIPLFNEIKPYPRASHSMIGINGDNIVLVGGVGLDGDNKNKILRDIWLFNTEELSWTRVDPMNGVLRGFCESWLCLHNHKLYLIGGLAERLDTWNEQITMIEFAEDETIRNEICSNCQQRNQIRDREEKAFPKTIHLSTGFFYNVSVEYRHPFQAIAGLH
jgi:N-acetylneuraminic acid mutarotase